jgi:hypothetical protein
MNRFLYQGFRFVSSFERSPQRRLNPKGFIVLFCVIFSGILSLDTHQRPRNSVRLGFDIDVETEN